MSFRRGWVFLICCSVLLLAGVSSAQVVVPEAPPASAKTQAFHDGHFGVRFEVPEGWTLARKDGQVSTFHLDARSASPGAKVRGVLAIQFNPYPYSTFSGALVYYSVQPHATDMECAGQATVSAASKSAKVRTEPEEQPLEINLSDVQDIGGMSFAHGHDEHGKICVEARDEVYTAYRKGACYRFDLAMNTFCSVSSGAADLTAAQLEEIDQRMTNILSTVQLAWEKPGPHPVPAPKLPSEQPVLSAKAATALVVRLQGGQ